MEEYTKKVQAKDWQITQLSNELVKVQQHRDNVIQQARDLRLQLDQEKEDHETCDEALSDMITGNQHQADEAQKLNKYNDRLLTRVIDLERQSAQQAEQLRAANKAMEVYKHQGANVLEPEERPRQAKSV